MAISILLVDDHKIVSDGLIALLRHAGDITIAATAGTGVEAIAAARAGSPDVVLMDLSLPDMGGLEAAREILTGNPRIRVLVFTMLLDRACVLDSLEAGVRGYLVKNCAAEELITAIRMIHAGKPYFCSEAQEVLMQSCLRDTPGSQPDSVLTVREREVLKMIAEGQHTKEIAFRLGVSTKMIETHRLNIKRKLGLNSIAHLTTYAVQTGLILLE